MRSKIIKQFAAGTCSVCLAYALAADAIGKLTAGPGTGTSAYAISQASITEILTPTPSPEVTDALSGIGSPSLATVRSDGEDVAASYVTGSDVTGSVAAAADASATVIANSSASSGGDSATVISADNETAATATVSENTDTAASPPTLSQYLSALRCGGCRHNCLLISPRCMKGRTKAQSATAEYDELYGA